MHVRSDAKWLACALASPLIAAQLSFGPSALAQSEPKEGAPAAHQLSGPPPGMPTEGKPPPGPPPVAYEACEHKREEEACRVRFSDREIQGTCVVGPEDKLFCMPDERPPRSATPGNEPL